MHRCQPDIAYVYAEFTLIYNIPTDSVYRSDKFMFID